MKNYKNCHKMKISELDPTLSREDISSRMRILLADGTPVALRDNYVEEVFKLVHTPESADRDWLREDLATSDLFFLSQAGETLRLVWKESQAETLHLVIDQSGSMTAMNEAVFAGAKEMVQDLPDDASVTLTTFASGLDLGRAMSKAQALASLSTRVANGATALYDAIVRVIEAEERNDASNLRTIVVLTDGQDTASRCTVDAVRAAVQRANARERWKILFLGTNQDAVCAAGNIGIPATQALTFSPDRVQTAMRSVSDNVRSRRNGDTRGFTEAHRSSSVTVTTSS